MATAREERAGPAWRFRPMTVADLPMVASLERASYAFPWNEQVFSDCLRVGYLCVVIDTDDGLVGYAVMSMGAGEAHLLNLCVAESLRRQGVGRRLLLAVLVQARDSGVRDAFLEVRRSNRIAMRLYESIGFRQVGLRRGYYQARDGREDALVFRLELGTLADG